MKIAVHIDREVAAHPELVQIENGYRNPREQKPGAVQRGHYCEIEAVVENPDAEPASPCAAAKTAIIVYGKRVGTTLTVCTDNDCPIHDPRAAARQAANPAPTMKPATETETEEETEERKAKYAQQRKDYEAEQEAEQNRRTEERKQEFERQQKEHEAERVKREKLYKARTAMFDRILENAPTTFTTAQLRVFLRALVNLDPYTFTDDVAEHFAGEDENNNQTAEEILISTLDGLADDKLTGFALRLVFTGHTSIPRESEIDFLKEAEAVFAPPQPKKTTSKTQKPTPIKAASKPATKKAATKKKAAA